MTDTPSDERVIDQVLAGAREDFGILVRRYLPMVQAIAYARLHGRESEDATQDAFLDAFQKLDRLRQRSKFPAWLAAIARNRCTRLGMARQRESSLNMENTRPQSVTPDPARDEMHALVLRQVESLKPDDREVLLLFYFAGHRVAEVAEILGVSVSAAKKRLERARKAFSAQVLEQLTPELFPAKPREARAKEITAAVIAAPAPWTLPVTWAPFPSRLAALTPKAAMVTAVVAVAAALVGIQQTESVPAKSDAATAATAIASTVSSQEPLVPPAAVQVQKTGAAPVPSAPTPVLSEARDEKGIESAKAFVGRAEVTRTLHQKVSIEFEGIHIREILDFLSESYDVNMVLDESVMPARVKARTGATEPIAPDSSQHEYATDGMVPTIDLEDVKLSDALSALTRPLGLEYVVEPGFIWISTPEQLSVDFIPDSPQRYALYDMQQQLEEPTSIKFENQIHLCEILSVVADSHDVNILCDWRVVAPPPKHPHAGDGIIPAIGVKDVELCDALKPLCRLLNLTYSVEDGFVFFSTAKQIDKHLFASPGAPVAAQVFQLASSEPNEITFEDTDLDSLLKCLGDSIRPRPQTFLIDNEAVAPPQSPTPERFPWDGRIQSISLERLPLRTVLNVLLRPHGMDYEVDGADIWISTAQRIAMKKLTRAGFRTAARCPSRAREIVPGAVLSETAPTVGPDIAAPALVSIQQTDGRYWACIKTVVSEWYTQGFQFERYELRAIDPETSTCQLYDEEDKVLLTLVLQPEKGSDVPLLPDGDAPDEDFQ